MYLIKKKVKTGWSAHKKGVRVCSILFPPVVFSASFSQPPTSAGSPTQIRPVEPPKGPLALSTGPTVSIHRHDCGFGSASFVHRSSQTAWDRLWPNEQPPHWLRAENLPRNLRGEVSSQSDQVDLRAGSVAQERPATQTCAFVHLSLQIHQIENGSRSVTTGMGARVR